MNDGYRKAALKLHSMSDADRGWMLQCLPKDDRIRLSTLLQELRELGIQSNRQVADDVATEDVRQELLSGVVEQAGLARALDIVCAARADEIAMLVAAEPDSMAAIVLSVYPWPWRAAYLAECGVEKRQRMRRALSQAPRLKPRLRGELVKMLAARMTVLCTQEFPLIDCREVQHAVKPVSPARTFWKGGRRWLP